MGRGATGASSRTTATRSWRSPDAAVVRQNSLVYVWDPQAERFEVHLSIPTRGDWDVEFFTVDTTVRFRSPSTPTTAPAMCSSRGRLFFVGFNLALVLL